MTFTIVSFGADDAQHLAAARRIRDEVFCREQGVSADLEWDGKDGQCTHFLLRDNDNAIATARLRKSGHDHKIERVAVLQRYRGQGAGRAIMQAVLEFLRARNHTPVILHAQTTVAEFYRNLGFVAEGPTFMEAGIPHVAMTLASMPAQSKKP